MKQNVLLLAALVGCAQALQWENTGDMPGFQYVQDLTQGPGDKLYCAVNSSESGWVYVADDFFNWHVTSAMPGNVKYVYSVIAAQGDTLLAGTRAVFNGGDSGQLYVSADRGLTWLHRSTFSPPVCGLKLTALLEDDSGYIYGGHDYFDGTWAFPPGRSTDRGQTWTQAGPVTPYCAYQYLIRQTANGYIYCGTWGYRGLVLRSTNHGASWTAGGELFDAGDTPGIVEREDGVLYACTYPKVMPQQPYGRVFRSTNQGMVWTEIGAGYFTNTDGIRSLCWTSDGRLFAGTSPRGEVFMSLDSGVTWQSAGVPQYCSVVYKLLEVNVQGTPYLYAATGDNGRVYRASLAMTGIGSSGLTGPARPLSIVPSVTRDRVEVSYAAAGQGPVRLRMHNKAGAVIRTWQVRPPAGGLKNLQLDVSDLTPGVYVLRIETQDGSTARQIVVN
jgi:photosystem II stability/assembly factor-like uncharacterized protein